MGDNVWVVECRSKRPGSRWMLQWVPSGGERMRACKYRDECRSMDTWEDHDLRVVPYVRRPQGESDG